jgi:thymidylate kinase
MKGVFITIYGVNNIGKSTHAKLLVKNFLKKGFDAVYLKYPIYDLEPTGPELNKIIREEGEQKIPESELQTLFMKNRRDFEPELKKLLKKGKIIVAEDYTGTGIAWGTAKGLAIEFMEKLNEDLQKEDLAILLTGRRDTRAEEKKHIHERNPRLMERVGDLLMRLAKKYEWKIVEIKPKIADTAEAVRKVAEEFLKQIRRGIVL